MKKIVIVLLLIVILFVSCIQQEAHEPSDKSVELAALGREGSMDEDNAAYGLLDLTDFGYWSVFMKASRLPEKLGKSAYYSFSVNGRTDTLAKNPFNPEILEIVLPGEYTKEELETARIKKTDTPPKDRGARTNGITIAKLIIEKTTPSNGTPLYGIEILDYISMYNDNNVFVFKDGQFNRPEYVKSNELNAYPVNTYFDAREVSESGDVNGAFDYLKGLDDYESYIAFVNPNRVYIENTQVKWHTPDERLRMRELGPMGELGETANAYNLIDDSGNSRINTRFNQTNLPSRYDGTYYWRIQVNEDKRYGFNQQGSTEIYETIIPYTDTDNREIVKNARFEAVNYLNPEIALKNPEEDGMIITTDVTLTWEATPGRESLSSRSSARITGYDVYFATKTADFPDPVSTTDKQIQQTNLRYGEEYKWRVTAKQDNNKETTTTTRTFQVAGQVTVYASDGSFVGLYEQLTDAVASATDHCEIIIYEDMTLDGPIDINGKTLTIRTNREDITATVTTNGSGRGFDITNKASVTLRGLRITNCSTDVIGGGGIYANNATLTIKDSEIASNTAASGGGVRVENTALTIEKVIIKKNKNNNSDLGVGGIGIYDSEPVLIKDSTITTNSAHNNCGGIFLANSTATLHSNEINDNTANDYGGGILIDESTVYNADGNRWRRFRAPAADPAFVEHNTDPENDNTYSNNHASPLEGSDIYFQFYSAEPPTSLETEPGTLTLRPESEDENKKVIMNVDFTAAAPMANASLTLTVPDPFAITDTSSVTIGDAPSATAGKYSPTSNSVMITDITATENTTITLRLTESEVPPGISPRGLTTRNIDYPFTARIDADGSGTAWNPSEQAVATFTAIDISTNTSIALKADKDYLSIAETPATMLQVASGTKAASVTNLLQGTDESTQTYELFYTDSATLDPTDIIPKEATLSVLSQWGEPYSAEYPVCSYTIKLATGTDNISWYETLNDAVTAAGTDEGRITLFTDTITESAITIDGAQLTIEPAGSYVPVTVDGEDSHRVFDITDGSSVTLRNLHIINGNSSDYGAGIASLDSTLALDTCEVRSNTADTQGGGIAHGVDNESGSLFVRNSTITANEASDNSGGGIACLFSDLVSITDSHIASNSTAKTGGGLYLHQVSDVFINRTEVASNSADMGAGGISFDNILGRATITNSTITANSVNANDDGTINGGGIVMSGAGETIIDSVVICENSVINSNSDGKAAGGGIAFDGGGNTYNATIRNNTISGNSADEGAGIFLKNGGTATVHSNTLEDNAEAGETELYIDSSDYQVTVKNADGDSWRNFPMPPATVTFVEHNENEASNNTYISSNIVQLLDFHYGSQNPTPTTEEGTITLSPTESTAGEATSVTIDFVAAGHFLNGSVTITLPPEFGLTSDNATVTLGANSTPAADYDSGNPFTIDSLNMGPASILSISLQSTPIPESGEYIFEAEADADGNGSAWTVSEGASDGFNSAAVGDFLVAYDGFSAATETLQGAVDLAHETKENLISICTDTVNAEQLSVMIDNKEITIQPTISIGMVNIDGGNATRAFHISNHASLTLQGLTVVNCKSSGSGETSNGGALYLNDATLAIKRCVFDSNECTQQDGGAIGCGSYGLFIQDATFTRNTAEKFGGAIYGDDASTNELSIEASTFASNTVNTAPGNSSYGGAITSLYGKTSITDSTLNDNEAVIGGAVYVILNTLVMENTTVDNNRSTNFGGGLMIDHGTLFTLNESTITSNISEGSGGGLCIGSNMYDPCIDIATVTSNLFDSNQATTSGSDKEGGGGIYIVNIDPSYPGYVSLYGNTIINNTVSSNRRGGGIWFDNISTIENSNGGTWEQFSSPASETYEVEGVGSPGDNTYSGNKINVATDTTGADIYYYVP